MALTIMIDELVLQGFGPLDGQAVRAAVRAELARLAVSGSEASQARYAPANAQNLGHQVARAVYGDLSQRTTTAPFIAGAAEANRL